MAEEVRVDARRVEPCLAGQPAQDEEGSGAGQPTALGVQEELRAVAPVEVGAATGEVPAEGLDRLVAEWHDPLFVALADAAHEPVLEVDRAPVEPHGLADAQAGAVEELHESSVAEGAGRRPPGGVDQALHFAG